jgi:hypothetical protein
MIADLRKLTNAIEEASTDGSLEQKITALRTQIAEALKTKGEYILTDEKGRAFRITSVNADEEE